MVNVCCANNKQGRQQKLITKTNSLALNKFIPFINVVNLLILYGFMCKKVLKAFFLPLVSGGGVDCKETEGVKPPAGKPPNPIIMLIFQSFNHGSDNHPY